MPIITEDALTNFDPADFSNIASEAAQAAHEDWKHVTVDG